MVPENVGPDDIADVVSMWTGIPAGRLLEGETEKLLRMEQVIGERLIGQKTAVATVSDAVRRARSGVADPQPGLSPSFWALLRSAASHGSPREIGRAHV